MRIILLVALLQPASALQFFDPIARFGPISEVPLKASKPLMLVLPGLDGSGITAWTQFPELAREYDVRALKIPADDRTSYDDLIGSCAQQIFDARPTYDEIYLLGESMGAGIALDVARREPPSALVLVSPAGAWNRTWLGRLRPWLLTLDDALLGLIVALTAYQLFDVGMMATTLRRVATGSKAPILDTPERTAYAWNVVKVATQRLETLGQPPL